MVKDSYSHEVLSPWADVDPMPVRGISPRLTDISDKKLGLFRNSKIAAHPVLTIVEKKLKERFPGLEVSHFEFLPNDSIGESADKARFEEWLKGLDAVILAHGD